MYIIYIYKYIVYTIYNILYTYNYRINIKSSTPNSRVLTTKY